MNEQIAQAEPWPLYSGWWLAIRSEPKKGYEGFDDIVISLEGEGDYTRDVTRIMVPEIDGLVCQSHSVPAMLIRQNLQAEKEKVRKLTEALKQIANIGYVCEETGQEWSCNPIEVAQQALKEIQGDENGK